eukprot:6747168-Lingulodinium_polyedra.AAC.1
MASRPWQGVRCPFVHGRFPRGGHSSAAARPWPSMPSRPTAMVSNGFAPHSQSSDGQPSMPSHPMALQPGH